MVKQVGGTAVCAVATAIGRGVASTVAALIGNRGSHDESVIAC